MLITGNDPLATYKAIFEGTGLQWLFPWVTGEDRELAALNLQQTLIITTPLILTGLAVAFAFRAGLFNIGGQGQYIVGAIAAVWVGSSFAGMPGFLHIVLAIVAACAGGRGLGGDRRPAQGDRRGQRGDLDDHAQLHRDLGRAVAVRPGRPAPERPRRLAAGVERRRRGGPAAGVLGRSDAPGPAHRAVHRARRGRRLLGPAQPLDHRLRGARGRPEPGGGALQRHERGAELRARDGRLRPVRRPGRRARRAGLAVPPRHQRHPDRPARVHRHRGRAARDATRRAARWPPRCCSARCSAARRSATSTRRSSSRSWRRTSR